MRFKLDENVPNDAIRILRKAGHDAVSVLDQDLGGKDDALIADVCRSEGRVLVTLDLDFANIRAYPPSDSPGLIVIRLARQERSLILRVLEGLVDLLDTNTPERRLWIVEESRVRIRE